MADEAGISESYLSRLEGGTRTSLGRETATRLAQALGLAPVRVQRAAGLLAPEDVAVLSRRVPIQEYLRDDPNLTKSQKAALVQLYWSVVRPGPSPSGSGSGSW